MDELSNLRKHVELQADRIDNLWQTNEELRLGHQKLGQLIIEAIRQVKDVAAKDKLLLALEELLDGCT